MTAAVRVLIVDSGIDVAHPALATARVSHFQVDERASGPPLVVPGEAGDDIGHGTAVASIVHAYAPNAELASVRLFGMGKRATTAALLAALDWGIAGGYDVINTSLGTTYLALLAKFKQRIDQAFVAGTVVVSASNNYDARIVEFPAHFPTVVSVEAAALDPCVVERVPKRLVEFRACGVDVRVAWRRREWAIVTGSSFAAPHVAAAVARIKEREPACNAAQVKSRLYDLAGALTWGQGQPKNQGDHPEREDHSND